MIGFENRYNDFKGKPINKLLISPKENAVFISFILVCYFIFLFKNIYIDAFIIYLFIYFFSFNLKKNILLTYTL